MIAPCKLCNACLECTANLRLHVQYLVRIEYIDVIVSHKSSQRLDNLFILGII